MKACTVGNNCKMSSGNNHKAQFSISPNPKFSSNPHAHRVVLLVSSYLRFHYL